MQLAIGQNVVHPNHGIGEVTDVTQMDLVEGFKRYYVIDFLTHNLTSHIPIRKTDDLGLRKTMSQKKVETVFETLRDLPDGLPSHYKKRKRQIEELLHSGRPTRIAQAVRELTWRKKSDGLSTSDNQMLSRGKEMLVEEIALVTASEEAEAKRKIDRALSKAVKAKRAVEEDEPVS